MTLARLLAAAVLLCSLSAFAQQSQNSQPSTRSRSSSCPFSCPIEGPILRDKLVFFDWSHYNVATASEPWRIYPKSPVTLVSGQTRPDQIPADQLKLEVRVRQLLESQVDRLAEEESACYTIRSYVVARDSKYSDSTHPVSYSTCQPAARYQLKTTEMRSVTHDR